MPNYFNFNFLAFRIREFNDIAKLDLLTLLIIQTKFDAFGAIFMKLKYLGCKFISWVFVIYIISYTNISIGFKGGKSQVASLFEKFNFNAGTDYIIKSIDGVKLPEDYLAFMQKHNGGEGFVGDAYVVMYPLEELIGVNEDYEIAKNHKDFFVFGSDGGGMLFGYNSALKRYYQIDSCNSDDDSSNRFSVATSLDSFFKEIQ